MNTITHRAPDGAAVLCVKICYDRPFYAPGAAAFEEMCRARLLPAAIAAYDACPDRRKKWRYRPLEAEFCAVGTEVVTLRIALCGRVLRHERHTFDGDLLRTRERLRDIL